MIDLEMAFVPSSDVVARKIGQELIIVPLAAGIGDTQDELFSLNASGQAIWQLLDGSRRLSEVVESLSTRFEAPADEIQNDVLGLIGELAKRGIVVETQRD